MQHDTGLYKKISNVYSPEDIAKWIADRKRWDEVIAWARNMMRLLLYGLKKCVVCVTARASRVRVGLAVTLETCIRVVLCLNLSYPDWGSSASPGKCHDTSSIRLWPPPSKSFPVCHLLCGLDMDRIMEWPPETYQFNFCCYQEACNVMMLYEGCETLCCWALCVSIWP
jgi:hypothetical protein